MTIFYSATQNGFYHSNVHKNLFSDTGEPIGIIKGAVKITTELHEDLLAGNAAGKQIAPDKNGHPKLVDYVFSVEEQWKQIREKRDELLSESDYTQMPDYDLINKHEWALYRQSLRNITNYPGPGEVVWPTAPA